MVFTDETTTLIAGARGKVLTADLAECILAATANGLFAIQAERADT